MQGKRELRQIEKAQRHPQAFAPLYEHYVALVWNYALARLRDHDRAAEATSTTFLKALNAIGRYRPEMRGDQTTFRSWLMTIARNVVVDELRRRPTIAMSADTFDLPSSADGPESIAIAQARRQYLLDAYAHLSDQQQDVIRLRQQGLSGEEIGAILGISAGAVKSTHHRSVLRRERLEEKGEIA